MDFFKNSKNNFFINYFIVIGSTPQIPGEENKANDDTKKDQNESENKEEHNEQNDNNKPEEKIPEKKQEEKPKKKSNFSFIKKKGATSDNNNTNNNKNNNNEDNKNYKSPTNDSDLSKLMEATSHPQSTSPNNSLSNSGNFSQPPLNTKTTSKPKTGFGFIKKGATPKTQNEEKKENIKKETEEIKDSDEEESEEEDEEKPKPIPKKTYKDYLIQLLSDPPKKSINLPSRNANILKPIPKSKLTHHETSPSQLLKNQHLNNKNNPNIKSIPDFKERLHKLKNKSKNKNKTKSKKKINVNELSQNIKINKNNQKRLYNKKEPPKKKKIKSNIISKYNEISSKEKSKISRNNKKIINISNIDSKLNLNNSNNKTIF